MQLSELLEQRVLDHDGQRLGNVIDVRLAISGDMDNQPDQPVIFGVIVSPRTTSSYLGYERSEVRSPALLAALLRWRHRGTFLTLWTDISSINADGITLKQGYQRYSPILRAQ